MLKAIGFSRAIAPSGWPLTRLEATKDPSGRPQVVVVVVVVAVVVDVVVVVILTSKLELKKQKNFKKACKD